MVQRSESRPIKVSLPYKYTITTSHIIGIYSYICVLTFSIVFLPHDTMPGNRQYTPCESIANGKAGGNPFIQQKENQSSTRPQAKPNRSSRSTESLVSLTSPTLPSRGGIQEEYSIGEKPRRRKNLGAFFMPIQKNFLTFFLRSTIIYVQRR